ncbi:MAG: DUF308 domain-containing protein [Candidatus Pacearchaeota archaeon]|jgi:uncharacterized membrane protein HdeD (DUF308 family)
MVFDKKEKEVLEGFKDFFLIFGIVMVIFGLLLMFFPVFGTIAIELLLGLTLLIIGIVGIVVGFVARKWKGSLFMLITGIVWLIVGLLLLLYPYKSIITLTLLMGILLILDSFFEMGKSYHLKSKFWRKVIFIDGFCALILGVLVIIGWPWDAEWAIGFLFGISILFSGIALIGLSSAVKKASK